MADIFISYAREDKNFVTRLHAALKARKREPWVDLEDIPPTAKWREKIHGGIEAARGVVFVLSPDSMASPECLKEIKHATAAHKRLIPLVCQEVEESSVPEELSSLNWIFCRERDDFEAAVETLLRAVDTDLEWVDAHTNLLQKATEWDRKGQDKSLLLRGEELREAENWQVQSGAKEPKPTELMGTFILASRRAATHSKNIFFGGAVAVALILAFIAVYAIRQRNTAIEQQNIARSRELASTAMNQIKVDPELAAVLSRKALDLSHTPQAEESLRYSLVSLLDSHVRVIIRRPHKSPVRGAAFSPDKNYNFIVTASEDGKARLWDRQSGDFKFELAVEEEPPNQMQPGELKTGVERIVYSADFSPDGRFIVTANAKLQARVWDAQTGKFLFKLAGEESHKGRVFGAVFCRDENVKRIVTAGEDQTARVWDAETGKFLVKLAGDKGHTGAVRSAEFSHSGKLIVTASDDGTARVWNAETGEFLREMGNKDQHKGKLYKACFCPQDKLIATAGADLIVRIWDAETGILKSELKGEKGHQGWVRSVAFDCQGNRLITASQDQKIRIWNLKTKRCDIVLTGHKGEVHSVAFSNDGKFLVSGGGDESARVWELDDFSKGLLTLSRAKRGEEGEDRDDYNDSRQVEARKGPKDGHRGRMHDNPENSHQGEVRSAAFNPDGGFIVTAGEDLTARVWDSQDGKPIFELKGHKGWVTGAAFSKDGRRIVTASGDMTVRVWDAVTGEFKFWLAKENGHKGWVYTASFSGDDKWIVTAGEDRTAKVWDAKTGKFLFELAGERGHKSRVTSAAFNHDNRRIVTSGQDQTAKVWDVETKTCLLELAGERGHRGWVYTAAFSSNDKRIVTAGEDQTARVWDAGTGECLLILKGHKGWVTSAAFRNTDDRIVTAGEDKTVRIWDAETGKLLVELPEHEGWVYSAAFSPSGKQIVTASQDKKARVFGDEMSCSFEDLLKLASPLVMRQLTPAEREKFLHEAVEAETVGWPIEYTCPKEGRTEMDFNKDRQGEDYQEFDLPLTDPTICQQACDGDPLCEAWTYVKPYTVKGPRPKCYLKKGVVPKLKDNPATVSGVKIPAAATSP